MWRTRGHVAAIDLLTASLKQGRVSHAYLISGPQRVGKATLARELAMALNCTSWQDDAQPGLFGPEGLSRSEPGPCYECPSCGKALAGAFPDLMVVEEWSTARTSIVDQVRSIQYSSGLLPYEGRHKVYVLLEAQELTLPAQNALLKTLEEPAASSCLILTASAPRALLPTVVSRCQQIQLRTPSRVAVTAALIEAKGLDAKQAELLAGLAAGRVGWALSAAEDPSMLEARSEAMESLRRALESGVGARMRQAEALAARAASDPATLDDTLELWLGWLRDVLLLIEGGERWLVNEDQAASLRAAASLLESRQVQGAIWAVQAARGQVAGRANTRLALEVLLLRLPHAALGATLAAGQSR